MQTESLPVGGTLRAVELAVFPVMAVHKAAPLMNAMLSDKMKCHRNFSEDSRFSSEMHSYKTPAPRFDFEMFSAHVHSMKSTATNKSMYGKRW